MRLRSLPDVVARWWQTVLAIGTILGVLATIGTWVWSVNAFLHTQADTNAALWENARISRAVLLWATDVSKLKGWPEPRLDDVRLERLGKRQVAPWSSSNAYAGTP